MDQFLDIQDSNSEDKPADKTGEILLFAQIDGVAEKNGPGQQAKKQDPEKSDVEEPKSKQAEALKQDRQAVKPLKLVASDTTGESSENLPRVGLKPAEATDKYSDIRNLNLPVNTDVLNGRESKLVISGSEKDQYGNNSALTKIVDISGASIMAAPSVYGGELWTDITERPGKVATTAGLSAGLGYGATYLLKKAPKRGKQALLLLAIGQGINYGARTVDFMNDAANVQSWGERQSLVQAGSLGLAREGTMLTEAAPGLFMGGRLAVRNHGKPPLYQSVQDSYKVTRAAIGESRLMTSIKDTGPGQTAARYMAFHGRGVVKLPSSVKVAPTAEVPYTRVNVMQIDEALGGTRANQFHLVEEARSIDVMKLRASKKVLGTTDGKKVDLGFRDRMGHIRQHTHRPGHELPSAADAQSTRHLGIIHSGNKTTFYVGKMTEFEALSSNALRMGAKQPDVHVPLQGIILDKGSRTATLFESVGSSTGPAAKIITKSPVKYDEAAKVLSELDLANPWTQLKAISELP